MPFDVMEHFGHDGKRLLIELEPAWPAGRAATLRIDYRVRQPRDGLYFFGPIVESYLGTRRYLGFYLLCGCSGAFFYLLLYYLGPLYSTVGYVVPLVGAAVYGLFLRQRAE